MMDAPCNCHVLEQAYRRARRENNRMIGENGIYDPELFSRCAEAWRAYDAARTNCPHRATYSHY